jgi:hypothetical protein
VASLVPVSLGPIARRLIVASSWTWIDIGPRTSVLLFSTEHQLLNRAHPFGSWTRMMSEHPGLVRLWPEGISMSTLQEKTERLAVARKSVEAFVAAGGNLKSAEGVPVVLELADAFDELANEFGHDCEIPLGKPADFHSA